MADRLERINQELKTYGQQQQRLSRAAGRLQQRRIGPAGAAVWTGSDAYDYSLPRVGAS